MMSRFGYPYGGDELRAQFARAVERAVASERARTEEALRELERYRRAVGELRAEVEDAREVAVEARREAEAWRREAVAARQEVAPRQREETKRLQAAEQAAASARAARDEAQAALDGLRAEVDELRAELERAHAELERAHAEVERARGAAKAGEVAAGQAGEVVETVGERGGAHQGEGGGLAQGEAGNSEGVEQLRLQQQALARDLAAVRRRQGEEVARARREERLATLKPWFAVLDDLDRALAAHPNAGADDPWLRGVQAVRRRGEEALGRLGVEPLDPRGEPFDPELHEALAQVPAPPGVETGTVLDVHQVGYRTRDGELLRPAKVVVAMG